MPGHAIDFPEYPSVNPAGAPSGDFERIDARPEMFGGLVAKGAEHLGQGIEKASDTGLQILTEQQKQLNSVDTAERHTDAVKRMTDAGEKFQTLEGHAALLGKDAHDKEIKGIYSDALESASNPAVKAQLAQTLSRDVDRSYEYASRHAASQEVSYSKKVAADNTLNSVNQAVWSYRNGDFPGWERYRRGALAETRNYFGHDSGIDPETGKLPDDAVKRIDAEVAKTNGRIVLDTTKLILDHPQGGPVKAGEFAKRYEKEINAQSNIAIDGMLKGASNIIAGHEKADVATGKAQSPTVSGAIRDVAVRYGIDPANLTRAVQIESGGNPNARTGSYKGVLQLSDAEFQKYKPRPDASIWNAADNLAAGAAKMKAEGDQFASNFGHQPSGFDSYMIHQQGLAGYSTHLANPEAPAWQNMLSTGEGKQKGDAWAKAAIWGNIPDQYKASFGNVNNVTSRAFIAMWQNKWDGGGAPIAASADIPNRAGIFAPGERPQFVDIRTGEGPQPAAVASPGALLAGLVPKSVAEQRLLDNVDLQNNPAQMSAAWERMNRTYQAADGQAADNERAQRQAEHAAKIVSDGNEIAVMKDIYSNKPSVTSKQIIEAGENGKLSREAVERLIGKLKGAGEHDVNNYGPGWWEVYQAIHAPVGDPGRITDPSQIYRITGPHGALTMAGSEKAIAEINAKKTPEGESEAAMKKQFFEHVARPQITFTNQDLKLHDKDGDENFLKFQVAAFDAYDKGRKVGKTPAQLLDPESADYIGKLIDRFKPDTNKTFADRMSDAAKTEGPSWSRIWSDLTGATNVAKLEGGETAAAEAPKAPTVDLASINSLADLKVAYDRNQIDGPTARRLALERGWNRSRTPPPLDIDKTRLRNADQ